MKYEDFFRLIYHILLGGALLLLSAVAEGGSTEFSRTLVPHTDDVPKMMESLVAGFVICAAGALGAAYQRREEKDT